MAEALDPILLTQALIRCPSVTPADAGALGLLAATLTGLGFDCHPLRFEEAGTEPVENLYARFGTGSPHFCFAGHTDVVPPGDLAGWSVDPFAAEIMGERVFGRGAADMKGGIAAFVAAVAQFLAETPEFGGSISLLITGDEEGPAVNGTKKMLEWLATRGETIDACVVGEPTNPRVLGEMMKIGRRGSLSGLLTIQGTQGHVAYPHLADNPIPKMVALLTALGSGALDGGTAHFQPSNLEVTTVDTGNPVSNLIPGTVTARFNVRFNDAFTSTTLEKLLRARLDSAEIPYDLQISVSGESFFTPPGPLSALVAEAVEAVLGVVPEMSTTGGTSDARFIRAYCPVVEFGLVGQSMHKVDENTRLADLTALTHIYRRMLDRYFS
ncbi:succinyl-diaminopimelate desuccinylase [Elstera sp.]|jgi:succinyl-diaminopimelate desuccinylase|uniref:succinyl-diaminopimelate desuccinylase n=1 Tax=Elstera sp. TaxID=1916664 RepID=UPI0037C0A499